jgi:small subunit ribosomal protein S6
MWILPGTSSEDEGAASVSTVKSLVSENGGNVKSAELWARRTLSYPINKHSEGAYYLARFSADAAAVPVIDRAMTADQTVLRHLVVLEERPKAVATES